MSAVSDAQLYAYARRVVYWYRYAFTSSNHDNLHPVSYSPPPDKTAGISNTEKTAVPQKFPHTTKELSDI